MKTLEPEQWRVVGSLVAECGVPVRLSVMLKKQDVSVEAVADLSERGLIVARLDGDEIDLTPGLIKTYRRKLFLSLSRSGSYFRREDPHRVLRLIGRVDNGMPLTSLLGMIPLDDLSEMARAGLVTAETADEPVNLVGARRRWAGSPLVVLPGGAELWNHAVNVRTTKTGQLYCERD